MWISLEKLFVLLFSVGALLYKQDNIGSVLPYGLTGKILCSFAHLKASFMSLLIRWPVLQNMERVLIIHVSFLIKREGPMQFSMEENLFLFPSTTGYQLARENNIWSKWESTVCIYGFA